MSDQRPTNFTTNGNSVRSTAWETLLRQITAVAETTSDAEALFHLASAFAQVTR